MNPKNGYSTTRNKSSNIDNDINLNKKYHTSKEENKELILLDEKISI